MNTPRGKNRSSDRTRNVGPSLRVFQINIEGISKSKAETLSRMLREHNIDVAVIQETHTANENQLLSRGNIEGYTLIGALYHRSYGSATYVKSSITNAKLLNMSSINDIYLITISVGDVKIINVYKPPNITWSSDVLPIYEHPSVYIGDFNSHHSEWCYSSNDINGIKLVDWAINNNFSLNFDAKDRKTFCSARWRQDYNPDLCFVSNNNNSMPLQSSRSVLNGFPHSQHRPVILKVGIQIPIINSIPKPRWNFNKANWKLFEKLLDANIRWIPPVHNNYDRFIGVVISSAKKSIPRGYRNEYIPGWNTESDRLYEEFLRSGDTEIADDLLHSLDELRQEKWIKTVESVNFKHSSRKAWSVIRKLGGSNSRPSNNDPTIKSSDIANRIVTLSKAPSDRLHTKEIKRELKQLKNNCQPTSEFSVPFTVNEINVAINQIKLGKAAGLDAVFPEFLKYSGIKTRVWLSKFFSNILATGTLPKFFKKTKIIAVLKPGKPSDRAESYRPIALLSTCYKLLERLIYNRISSVIEDYLPVEQAGFRPMRNCTDQLLSLTSFIEAGFQKKQKTGAVFIDLTAAYDTVWREGLLFKFIKLVPCKTIYRLLNNMLSNRMFNVFLGDDVSRTRMLNNGLPQGSVLAPLLFNLYLIDLPNTTSRKFGYADDWTLATQHQEMSVLENVLSEDLVIMKRYFGKWRLCPNVCKTECSCFHLNNKLAKNELSVGFNGAILRYNHLPKYLGVTLDRTLSYRQHLENTSGKLRTRNNIIQRLAGTSWGATTHTLRVSSLALVYPVAEYGCPVWLNSAHTQLIDRQLNASMRIITGTISSTPIPWLSVLSNIAPPHLRRQKALLHEHHKIMDNPALPIHDVYGDHIIQRLKSRKPSAVSAKELISTNFDINETWLAFWLESKPASSWIDIDDPTSTLPGSELPRKLWSTLNRIRTNHGRCADSFYKWGINPSPECDCGASNQTIKHITLDCPLRCYSGDIENIQNATPDFVNWMRQLDVQI